MASDGLDNDAGKDRDGILDVEDTDADGDGVVDAQEEEGEESPGVGFFALARV